MCIAPKQSRRAQFWKATVEQYHQKFIHVTYQDVIQGANPFIRGTRYHIRLESPGEDFETYKLLLLEGCDSAAAQRKIEHMPEDFGQVADFSRWYRGWQRVLKKVKIMASGYDTEFINHPDDILKAFDKYHTQTYLNAQKLPCPPLLGPCSGYASLVKMMKQAGMQQVFVKPFYGSSASGVMAFRYINTQKQALYTTINAKENGKLYNNLRIKRYTQPDTIQRIIDLMASKKLMAEQWIPKWAFNGYAIDFRVVVISGEVAFIQPRGSKGAITNLHLGNQKLRIEETGISEKITERIEQCALKTMRLFPGLGYAGIDVLVDRQGEVYVLEVNAFGDMLLGVKDSNGRNVYVRMFEMLFGKEV